MTNTRVIAAVVDTKQLTMYKEDGSTIVIPQGDPRLRPILDQITPVISRGGVAEIDLSKDNAYRTFEEQSGGLVKFFRIAKKKVSNFFNSVEEPVAPTKVTPLGTAIEDIMAHAKPVADKTFLEDDHTSEDTMIAVMGEGENRKVIPGVENLKNQFEYANKLGSQKGVQAFLNRIATVIEQRQHSIHDLLKFMQRGDLPIAEDGSIVIYKILRNADKEGYFVDCHTRKVQQRVGSYVCMDAKMVDHNRRQECSNGLHVARRGYLGQFPGDTCVIAKVAPEDVIAVPERDPHKMRVCGYHILFEVSKDDFNTLRANRPMTDNKAAQLLVGRAISGDHIGKIEEVRITGQQGQGVVVKQLVAGKYQPAETVPLVKAIETDETGAVMAEPVNPKQVAQEVTAEKAKAPKPATLPINGLSNADAAFALFKDGNYAGLIAFKKAKKKSWDALRIGVDMVAVIMAAPAQTETPKPKAEPKAPVKRAAKVKAEPVKRTKAPTPVVDKTGSKTWTPNQAHARLLFEKGDYKTLNVYKSAKKKSWFNLGFREDEVELIKSKLKG